MSVHRKGDHWQLFNESNTGIAVRNYDVVFPDDLTADQLATFLDDIFHEYATEFMPRVEPIE